jgi:hypothetical protein
MTKVIEILLVSLVTVVGCLVVQFAVVWVRCARLRRGDELASSND